MTEQDNWESHDWSPDDHKCRSCGASISDKQPCPFPGGKEICSHDGKPCWIAGAPTTPNDRHRRCGTSSCGRPTIANWNDTMSDNLLPCPFCGAAAVYGEVGDSASLDFGGHYIGCSNNRCGASTNLRFAGGDDPRPLLAEQWNQRTRADASACERALAWCVENDHECLGDHPARLQAALLLLREPQE